MADLHCYDFLDALSKAETVEDLRSVCENVSKFFGFERFIYGARIPTSFAKPYFIVVSSYPDEWRERYNEHKYMAIDPTVVHCAESLTPIIWQDIKQDSEHGDIRVMNEAQQYGLKSGVSFPVHTAQGDFAMLSLVSSEEHAKTKQRILEAIPWGHLFIAYLHEAVRRIFNDEIVPLMQVHLTKRERECLLWAAEGKTTWETSHILDISERTVIYHLQNAAHKLKVVNRAHAVARAVAMGLILPSND